jgi:hypothetical protein
VISIWRSEANLLTKCRLAKVGLVNKEPGSCEFVNVFFIVVFFLANDFFYLTNFWKEWNWLFLGGCKQQMRPIGHLDQEKV